MTPADGPTLLSLLREGERVLAAAGSGSPRLDAEVLTAHALGVDRGRLAAMQAAPGAGALPPGQTSVCRALFARRARLEPVAYIVGTREFWSLPLEVTPDVLIPRPETEILVARALERLPAPADGSIEVADVGTGSGAVAIALAVERTDVRVLAIDASAAALAVAGRNTRRHGVAGRVELIEGDLLAPLTMRGPLPMVVSNPPYVSLTERPALMPDVRDWEPAAALFAGEDGMEAIARLVPQAARVLRPGGWLLLELSRERLPATLGLLSKAGMWQDPQVHEDYAGQPRVVAVRLREEAARS